MKKLVIKDWKKSMAPTLPHVWKDATGEIILLNASNRNSWGQGNWLFDNEQDAKKQFENVKESLENESRVIDPIAKALEEGTYDWEANSYSLSVHYLHSVDFEAIPIPYNEVTTVTKDADGYDRVKVTKQNVFPPEIKKQFTAQVFKAKASIDEYRSRLSTLVLTPLAIDNLHLGGDEEQIDEVEGEW